MTGAIGGAVEDGLTLQQGVPYAMAVGAVIAFALALFTAWPLSQYPLSRAWLMVSVPAVGLSLPLAPAFGAGCAITGTVGYIIGCAALLAAGAPLGDGMDYQGAGAERILDDDDSDEDVYPAA
jgi:hypothetical protein